MSQILTVHQILEGVHAKNQEATILFIDFAQAFDSKHRGKIEQILLCLQPTQRNCHSHNDATFQPNFTSGCLQVINCIVRKTTKTTTMRTKVCNKKLILRLRSLISKRIPNKDNYKFGTDLTMEDQIRRTNNWIHKTKKSNLDRRFGARGTADRGVESLQFQVGIDRR